MLSTAADLTQLAAAAPWLAVGVLSLAVAAWVYRQGRRAVKAAEDRCAVSAVRQGKRIGDLEHTVGLLDLRRRQVEWELLDQGLELPPWPPDGAPRPRPRNTPDEVAGGPDTEYAPRVPVPPLPADVAARHRRERNPA